MVHCRPHRGLVRSRRREWQWKSSVGRLAGSASRLFHQNKPDIGAAIARQWFDVEHVDVVADLSNSAVGFAVVEVAKPLNKIVLVSGPGSSDFTGKACAPTSIHWTWDTYAAASGVARALVGPDARTWFMIASD